MFKIIENVASIGLEHNGPGRFLNYSGLYNKNSADSGLKKVEDGLEFEEESKGELIDTSSNILHNYDSDFAMDP